MRSGSRIYLLAVVVLAAVGTLPFVNQALHIDDQVFLMGADIVARTPARPHTGRVDLFGDNIPWIRANQHPPGLPYYLALMRGLAGASEPALHLAMLPFLALLLLATWKLAEALGAHPGWSTLGVLSAAPVLVASHTLMTDVPLAALFTASLWALLRVRQSGKPGWIVAAVLLCSATWFMQYRGFLLLVVAPALLWETTPKRPAAGVDPGILTGLPALRSVLGTPHMPWALAVLGSIPALFGAWCGWNLWEMGQLHFFDASGMIDYGVERLALSTTAMLAYAGGTVGTLALLALWQLRRRPRVLAGLVLTCAVLAALLPMLMPHQTPGPRLAAALLALVGALSLGGCALAAWCAPRPARLLALVLLGLLALQCVVSLFACARMLVLLLPLCLIALLRGMPDPGRAGRRLLGACLGANLLWALALSWADTAHAEAYRALAPRVAARASAGGRGWFMGEWGLRNYLEASGLTYLRGNDRRPRKGDWLLVPGLNCPSPLHPELRQRLGPPRTLTVPGRFPLRLMDPALGAGYYTDGYGVLPFAWTSGDRPYDTLKIYRVLR